MDKKTRNLELEAWLIETTGEEMMANHLGPNWNRFNEEIGFYPNISMTIADQVWQHQQAKVEKAQANAELLNEAFQRSVAREEELQKRVEALVLALDQIAYPIPHMQKEAELNGCELNGYWAVKMSEDHTYSKDIARRALEKEQALKGEESK
ncbi:hypothetical protein [Acinetobacter oleivorans]|uniref:hypothetical protein n=1 Tax=Acinetobacter oleivorans TaxID=1148157 RepID=UPI001D18E56D|nr:hypothetical protein [Acinetobacter oleivorans]